MRLENMNSDPLVLNRKRMIQHAFDTVAKGYDHPSLAFFPETATSMVEHLGLAETCHLLDVCAGTGVVSLCAARQLVQGKVMGIDLSSGMLQQAQMKADEEGINNVMFKQMDLDHMDFPQHNFDAATCSFGLFFLEDMQPGLQNIADAVKPGGKIAISTFAEGAFEPMSSLFLERYESFGKEAPPPSWKRLASEEALTRIFRSVGIETVDIYQEKLGCQLSSPQNWWDVVWNAGYRGFLNQLSELEQIAFKQQHMNEIRELCAEENVWLDTSVFIAIGTKLEDGKI